MTLGKALHSNASLVPEHLLSENAQHVNSYQVSTDTDQSHKGGTYSHTSLHRQLARSYFTPTNEHYKYTNHSASTQQATEVKGFWLLSMNPMYTFLTDIQVVTSKCHR